MKRLIGEGVKIGKNVRIKVTEYLRIGDRSVINDNVLIEGRRIEIGNEAWIDEYAHIGGGSCFDYQAFLKAGHFLHMGKFSHINTARGVTIGDECGIGINSKIFTHGAYLSAYQGFPVPFAGVTIGSRVWLPNAWVNPGVNIGDDVVVAAMSLVNSDLPSGCLAGGIPARVLQAGAYPNRLTSKEKRSLVNLISKDLRMHFEYSQNSLIVRNPNGRYTKFNLETRDIIGEGTGSAEMVKNQLRRYGIRFRYYLDNGSYRKW